MRIGSFWAMAGAARPDVSDTMPAAEPARTVRRLIDMSFPPDVFCGFGALDGACLRRAYRSRPTAVNALRASVAGRAATRAPVSIPAAIAAGFRRRSRPGVPPTSTTIARSSGAGSCKVANWLSSKRGRHEMALSRRHALADQLARALEMDQADIGPIADDDVAIGAFQRRAGDDPRLHRGCASRRSGPRCGAARGCGRRR